MVCQKQGRVYLKHNKFTAEIPFAVVMKAMGVSSDQEIATLVGVHTNPELGSLLGPVGGPGTFSKPPLTCAPPCACAH